MTKTAANLIVRFYGRFVFAQSKRNPEQLTVLAIKMDYNRAVHAPVHSPSLSILNRNVDRAHFGPTRRIIAAESAHEGGHDLWYIDGCEIDIPIDIGAAQAEFWQNTQVADLGELSGQELNKKYLRSVRPNAATSALIRLHSSAARGLSLARKPVKYEFVLPKRQPHRAVVRDGTLKRLADAVEMHLNVRASTLKLSIKHKGRRSHVTLRPESIEPVVLSFSNLCTESRSDFDDTEFAGFYDILVRPPDVRRRWIPRAIPTPGIGEMPMPFGDCFLAARISY